MRSLPKVNMFLIIPLAWSIILAGFFLFLNFVSPNITTNVNFMIALVMVLSTFLLFIFSWLLSIYLFKYMVHPSEKSLINITPSEKHFNKIKQLILSKNNIFAKKNELFYERVTKLIIESHRYQKVFAFLLVELGKDHHKLRHNQADESLINAIMDKTKSILRSGDIMTRIKNTSFVILLADIKKPKFAAPICEKLLKTAHRLIATQQYALYIGIAIYPYDSDSVEELQQKAQVALYKAKYFAEQNYYYYEDSLNKVAYEYSRLKSAFLNAINNNNLTLHFQPQLALETNSVKRVEALVRLIDPLLGHISPSVLIPMAEEIGAYDDLGKFVIREACKCCKEWLDQDYQFACICVNISHKQFHSQHLLTFIKESLKEFKLDAKYLEIEITETIVMDDIDYAIQKLTEMHQMGIQIALDDFGTGYTSINYLKQLPIDVLKIDKSFIEGIPHNKHNTAITKAIIGLCHNLNIEVVAEGVENEEQLNYLQRLHCDLIQGYMYSNPISAKELLRFLERK